MPVRLGEPGAPIEDQIDAGEDHWFIDILGPCASRCGRDGPAADGTHPVRLVASQMDKITAALAS
jgi:hypothetical protein